MFLRVLLNLVMHNYPALVSGSLQLLFRHFSQRQEVLQAFKQVIHYLSKNINRVKCTFHNVDSGLYAYRVFEVMNGHNDASDKGMSLVYSHISETEISDFYCNYSIMT